MKDQEMELKEKKEVKKVAGEGTRPGPVFIPAVDILENANEIIVLADMPGVESKSVDIDLKDNQLTITGKVDAPKEKKRRLYTRNSTGGIISGSSLSRM